MQFLRSYLKPLLPLAQVLALVGAASLLCAWLDARISLTSQAMIFLLAVVFAAYRLRWQDSVLCAVLAVMGFNYLFVPPRYSLAVEGPQNMIALAVMLLIGLVISHLAERQRGEALQARRNEKRARQLQALSAALTDAHTPLQVRLLGQEALDSAFAGPVVIALRQSDGALDLPADLSQGVFDGLHACMREAAVLGPGTGRWPGLNAWYLPLGDRQHLCGAVYIGLADAADVAGREHAQGLCALLAQSLWRLRLTSSVQAAEDEAQRQQWRSTFLAAIAHDLRTPLAAVVGAASALQTQRDKLDADAQQGLLDHIANEASYLSAVTENTLQLVQMANTPAALHRDWESMEEIVGAVLARLRARDPARRIRFCVPENLPLLRADPVLLAQLLTNLLDNALKFSQDAIDLQVGVSDGQMEVAVKDRGPGIPEEQRAGIFEPYVRGDHGAQRGAGLGLAVCRAIAQAHGGSLRFFARRGGGAKFVLRLPLEAQQPQEAPTP